MRHANELKLFRGSARRPGFAQELGRLLNELQQHQLTPAKLRSLAQREDLSATNCAPNSTTSHCFRKTMPTGCATMNCRTEITCSILPPNACDSSSAIRNSQFTIDGLWLDGFAEMTPQELDLLAAICPFANAPRSRSAWMNPAWKTVKIPGSPSGQLWANPSNNAASAWKICRSANPIIEILPRGSNQNRFAKSPELARLEARWSQSRRIHEQTESAIGHRQSAISLVACPNAEAEAIFAAREILKFVRAGNRFRDCAVLVRNLDAITSRWRAYFIATKFHFFSTAANPSRITRSPNSPAARFAPSRLTGNQRTGSPR